MAADVIREPFAVINADDFYGAESYRVLADHLKSGSPDFSMVGFILRNTLSDFGSVARGVCRVDGAGYLQTVEELTSIVRHGEHAKNTDLYGKVTELSGDESVSMNMWGFTPDIFDKLRTVFHGFLERSGKEMKTGSYIPTAVNELVAADRAREGLRSSDPWFGVTYARIDRASWMASAVDCHRPILCATVAMRATGEIEAAARHFQIAGKFIEAEPFGSGHINDSYCVLFRQGGSDRRYLLQRINIHVFKDPAALMQNMARVTSHIAGLIEHEPDRERRALALIPSDDGSWLHFDTSDGCWRMMHFIERSQALESVESPQQAFQVAAAFGRFQQQLANLPAPRLNDTIPDFHNTPKRFAALEAAIESDVLNRAQFAKAELEFALARKAVSAVLLEADLPERITHNDTKSSNVLLDEVTGEGLCVIDLDTVMPGLALYDFGDMVRAMTSPAAEDERNLSRVGLQLPVFEALARGYLSSAGELLNSREKQFLTFSGKLITFENGLRFLSDYLNGDSYYKVHREGQNLDRCRAQFKLVESIEEQEEELYRLVESLT
jgi:hypothetical protein